MQVPLVGLRRSFFHRACWPWILGFRFQVLFIACGNNNVCKQTEQLCLWRASTLGAKAVEGLGSMSFAVVELVIEGT